MSENQDIEEMTQVVDVRFIRLRGINVRSFVFFGPSFLERGRSSLVLMLDVDQDIEEGRLHNGDQAV